MTGIASRHVAADHEQASDLALEASRKLFAAGEVDPSSIDLLLFASASRDMVEPATSHIVQYQLGTKAHCLDLTNACNSFLNGIDIARAMILAERARKVLVCSGEVPSRAVRHSIGSLEQLHRSFAGFTFGDAGAAVLVEPVRDGGLLHVDGRAYSEHWEIGGVFGGGTRYPRQEEWSYFHGDGEQLRLAFEQVGPGPVYEALEAAGVSMSDISRVLCHQVTVPYLHRFVEVTGIDPDKIFTTVDTLGNIASCTIPVQLAQVWGDLCPGEVVLFVGLGGGASLATAVWQR
jgi:3-oxoacyl-[acyl-carrier-protein] synthase-3